MKRLLILLLSASPCMAQTHTFCAQDIPCVFNTLNGAQHVNANQTFATALAAVSNPGAIVIDPGTYTVSANSTIPAGVSLVSESGGILSIATATTLTVNGPIFAPANQLFAYVGTGTAVVAQGNVEALWFPGANLGIQVNNAALAINNSKANGNTKGSGKIHIQAGVYSVPLGVMNPQGEVILSCDENQSTNIAFTGVSGIAVLFNTGTSTGSYNDWGVGIENCQLSGPGSAGTGIQLGDASHATIGFRMNGGLIQNFAIGFNWGANGNSFGVKFDHTAFNTNTQDFIYNPNAGGGTENVELDHVVFAPSFSSVIANDVVIGNGSTTTDIWFNNCSFDNGEVVISNSSKVGFSKPHFEYGFNTTTPFLSVSGGSANVSLYSPVFQYDPSSGSVPPEAVLTTGGIVDMYTPSFVSNVASITNYLNATNTTTRVWGVATRTNTGVATYSSGSHTECPDTTGNCTFSIGSGTFQALTSGTIFLQASSIIQFQGPGIDIVEGNLNPQAGTLNIGEQAATHMISASVNNSAVGSIPFTACSTSQKTESAADANVLTCVIPAIIGSYRLRFVMSVSAANAATLGWTATWTDSNGAAQTPANLALFQSGVAAPALTFTTSAAGNYYGDAQIDVSNAGTSPVIKLTFSGTSFTAKVSASVERLI